MPRKPPESEYQQLRSSRKTKQMQVCTLKTCLQFFPLSFNLLSNISMISTNSFLIVSPSHQRKPSTCC